MESQCTSRPRCHSQAALGVGNAAAQREQLVAEHKKLQKSYSDYLGIEKAGKELIRGRQQCTRATQTALHRFLRLNGARNDQPSPPQNGNQDDYSAEARVQDDRIQQSVGSNHKHHGVFHET